MKGQSLGDGFQLSDLGTCARRSVPQVFYQAPTMCWEQSPTLPWPPTEDVESTFSNTGIWQPWCFIPQEVCCLIKHLFFFKPGRGRGEEGREWGEREGEGERERAAHTSCHFTLQALGKMRTLGSFQRTPSEMARSKDPQASSDSGCSLPVPAACSAASRV